MMGKKIKYFGLGRQERKGFPEDSLPGD